LLVLCVIAYSANTPVFADFGNRYALVIGNGAYSNAEVLPNPRRDAEAIAAELTKLQFNVTKGIDLNASAFRRLFEEFRSKISDADTVLFYYAGHGFQLNGENYLVPVDARLRDRSTISQETLQLSQIIGSINSRSHQTIVLLDACRNNPLPESVRGESAVDGLAQLQTGQGTFVAFATQPGNITRDGSERNSPFTRALLTHMARPGLNISDMMIEVRNEVDDATLGSQVPWDQSSLRSQFYFNPEVRIADLPPIECELNSKNFRLGRCKVEEPKPVKSVKTETRILKPVNETLIDTQPLQSRPEKPKDEKVETLADNAAEAGPKPRPSKPTGNQFASLTNNTGVTVSQPPAGNSTDNTDNKVVTRSPRIPVTASPAGPGKVQDGKGSDPITTGSLPNSPPRPDKTKGIEFAALDPTAPVPVLPGKRQPPDEPPQDIAKPIREHLQRIGCYTGQLDGEWNDPSRVAAGKYYREKGIALPKLEPLEPTAKLLAALEKETAAVCKDEKKKETVKTPTKKKTVKTPTKPKTVKTPTKKKTVKKPTKPKTVKTSTKQKTVNTPVENKTGAKTKPPTFSGVFR